MKITAETKPSSEGLNYDIEQISPKVAKDIENRKIIKLGIQYRLTLKMSLEKRQPKKLRKENFQKIILNYLQEFKEIVFRLKKIIKKIPEHNQAKKDDSKTLQGKTKNRFHERFGNPNIAPDFSKLTLESRKKSRYIFNVLR